jgi:prepilin-type processing-associated H-X9-DG protein
MDDFKKSDSVILAISTSPVVGIKRLAKEEKLTFPMLTDDMNVREKAGRRAALDYGVLNKDGIPNRVTFVIDKKGIVRKVFDVKDAKKHPQEVLEYLKSMKPSSADAGEPDEPAPVTKEDSRPQALRADGLTPSDLGCSSNLHQIARAMHYFHDAYDQLPPVAKFDKEGKPLLSWRVNLLAYLDQEDLYREFNLNEPWDSEHNKKLIARMPPVYRCPQGRHADTGKTTYLVPVGPRSGPNATLFSGGSEARNLTRVPDGTPNTIMLLEVDDAHAVPWTKPDDLKIDPDKPMTALVGHHPGKIAVAFADGSVRFLKSTIDKEKLKALFTYNSGWTRNLTPADGIIAPPPAAR